eukprot:Lankesteria_metandrocarpae@DN6564_c0_g1_i1.p1
MTHYFSMESGAPLASLIRVAAIYSLPEAFTSEKSIIQVFFAIRPLLASSRLGDVNVRLKCSAVRQDSSSSSSDAVKVFVLSENKDHNDSSDTT